MKYQNGNYDIYDKYDNLAVKISRGRLGCESDAYEAGERYGFVVVYTIGSWPAKAETGYNIYPGYFIIFKSSHLESSRTTPGQPCY